MSQVCWDMKRTPWDDPQWQQQYGDDLHAEVKMGNMPILSVSVAECIEAAGPRFVMAHALECVKQGLWDLEESDHLAGEVSAWASSLRRRKRK